MVNPVEPDLSHWGPLTTELFTAGGEGQQIYPALVDEVAAFYDAMLVPDLACTDSGVDRPSPGWMSSEGRKIVTTRDQYGVLRGCWVIKDGGIYYPCVDVTKGVPGAIPVLRALAYKSWEEEMDNLYAETSNPLIQAWVNMATSTPETDRPLDMPLVRFSGDGTRVEWKH